MDDELQASARKIRAAVCEKSMRGAALLDAILAVSPGQRDAFVDALLALPELPSDSPDLPKGGVPYLPCGIDAIVRVVREAPVRSNDVFVDLGAGLGRVTTLVHLLSGARAVGVEVQPHLIMEAQRTATRLNLDAVDYRIGDAATVEINEGSIFFIYASFGRSTLLRVLAQLQKIAAQRRITLCAVDFEVHDQPWLKARPSQGAELVFYDSRD